MTWGGCQKYEGISEASHELGTSGCIGANRIWVLPHRGWWCNTPQFGISYTVIDTDWYGFLYRTPYLFYTWGLYYGCIGKCWVLSTMCMIGVRCFRYACVRLGSVIHGRALGFMKKACRISMWSHVWHLERKVREQLWRDRKKWKQMGNVGIHTWHMGCYY